MSVNLPVFLLAVALLWFPRSWLRVGPTAWRSRRKRSSTHAWTHAPADGTTLTFGYEFAKVRNYVDLFRAAVATAALVGSNHVTSALFAAPDGPIGTEKKVLLLRVGILLVAVLIQTLRRDRRGLGLAAPIFFLGGLAIGLQVPVAGVGAFAIAWAVVPVFPYAQAFLLVEALVFGALSVVLGGITPLAFVGAALCAVPVLISVLSRRPLLVYSRRSGSSRNAA